MCTSPTLSRPAGVRPPGVAPQAHVDGHQSDRVATRGRAHARVHGLNEVQVVGRVAPEPRRVERAALAGRGAHLPVGVHEGQPARRAAVSRVAQPAARGVLRRGARQRRRGERERERAEGGVRAVSESEEEAGDEQRRVEDGASSAPLGQPRRRQPVDAVEQLALDGSRAWRPRARAVKVRRAR